MKRHIVHTIRHEAERCAPDDAFMYEGTRADALVNQGVARNTADRNLHVCAWCRLHAVISREENMMAAHTGTRVTM